MCVGVVCVCVCVCVCGVYVWYVCVCMCGMCVCWCVVCVCVCVCVCVRVFFVLSFTIMLVYIISSCQVTKSNFILVECVVIRHQVKTRNAM